MHLASKVVKDSQEAAESYSPLTGDLLKTEGTG